MHAPRQSLAYASGFQGGSPTRERGRQLSLAYASGFQGVAGAIALPAFQGVPKEIEEAAFVDGYGAYSVFWRIALPVAARSLAGAIAFSFVLVWNEFLIALMLSSSNAKTLPIVASELSQQGMNVPWGILNASGVLLSLPPLLFLGVLSGFLNSVFRQKKI